MCGPKHLLSYEDHRGDLVEGMQQLEKHELTLGKEEGIEQCSSLSL